MILYRYAKDENNKLVNIKEINQINKNKKYYCLGCNNSLIPRAIKSVKVTSHFYHYSKNNEQKCNPESYIHKLAKSLFLEHFELQKNFIIEWIETQYCTNKFSNSKCIKNKSEQINLIEKYPYYEVEKKDVNGYIPDILLRNENNEKLYIEFAYTHFSTIEKKETNIPIIEISINNEDDIKNILKDNIIKEGKNIEFINFKTGSFDCNGKCIIQKIEEPKVSYKSISIIEQKERKTGDLFVPLKCYICNQTNYAKIATIETSLFNGKLYFISIIEQKEIEYKDISFPITQRKKIFGKDKNYYEHFCPKCNCFISKRKEPPLFLRKGKVLKANEKWIEHK